MGGRIEAAFLNTFQARWQLANDEVGLGFAQGKTMLLRRSSPRGGLAALTSEVAEDAAATKLARRLGRQVRVVDRPFPQPLGRRTYAGVAASAARARLRRLSFPGFSASSSRPAACFPAFSRLGSRPRASCRGRASRR